MSERAPSPPAEVYAERLRRREDAVARLRRRADELSWLRLAIFVAGAVLLWAVAFRGRPAAAWLVLPVAVFAAVAVVHERVHRRLRGARRAVVLYSDGLDRLADRWAGRGRGGQEFLDPGHPFAVDLDLFGPGSLFELLCTARTRGGETVLAAWLREPAAVADVRERQRALGELRDRLDLREDLALLGEDVAGRVDSAALVAWAEAPPLLRGLAPVALGAGLATANLAGLLLWGWTPWPALAAGLASAAFVAAHRNRVRRVLVGAGRPEHDLRLLAGLLARLEHERFDDPLLARLRAALEREGRSASRCIAALARLIELRDSRRNLVFAPLAALTLFGTQLGFAIERWRARDGRAIAPWLDALARFEALSSLARHAYEHPQDPFPVLTDAGPCFDGEGLGHPLLPEGRSVRNDLRLDAGLRLLLVSGSNMSGKSTLLRTVGVNAVLALAGAPVRARALRLSALAVGACLRVQDSLQQGVSHFYAEVRRLRQLTDLAASDRPLLFLLDEIFHGTNSNDRLVGAAAVVRGLIERGAVGLVTTHDLALGRIVDELAPAAANVHFSDRIEDGRLVFDYRLRPGLVDHGNALALLRAAGLWSPAP